MPLFGHLNYFNYDRTFWGRVMKLKFEMHVDVRGEIRRKYSLGAE